MKWNLIQVSPRCYLVEEERKCINRSFEITDKIVFLKKRRLGLKTGDQKLSAGYKMKKQI